jgi:hypothetical protein
MEGGMFPQAFRIGLDINLVVLVRNRTHVAFGRHGRLMSLSGGMSSGG